MGFCSAADSPDAAKPVAVISLASYEEVLGDVNWIGKLAERPDLGRALEGLLAVVTQGKGLTGLGQVAALGRHHRGRGPADRRLCVRPRHRSETTVGRPGGLYTTVEPSNDLYKISPKGKGKTLYVKGAGPWAFAAEKPESLAHVVADPLALLGGMEKQYLLSARLFAANLPGELREKLVAGITKDARKNFAKGRRAGASPARAEVRQRTFGRVDQPRSGPGPGHAGLGPGPQGQEHAVGREHHGPQRHAAGLADGVPADCEQFCRLPAARGRGVRQLGRHAPHHEDRDADPLLDAVHAEALRGIEKKNEPNAAVAKEIVNDLAEVLQKTVKSGRSDGAAQ